MSKTIRRRLTLTHDGRTFLDRWGRVHDRIGGVYLHHIADADPGIDLHDHPWWFVSIVIKGCYWEVRASTRAPAAIVRGQRRRWSIKTMRLDEIHRITNAAPGTWTIVLRGPTVRKWGFYVRNTVMGRWDWVWHEAYDYAKRRPSKAVGNHIGETGRTNG